MTSSATKWKEEGNKLFLKRNYKEAIEMYTKAIEKASTATHYTNRALCYFKLQQWLMTIEDCRRAIEIDPHSVKAFFFLGQSLGELNHYDEAIVHLKQAHELAKELHENYGDEITRTIRNLKRKRWNFMEDKRIKQEVELQTYLNRLMLEDKQKQINKIRENSVHGGKKSAMTNGNVTSPSIISVKPSTSTVIDGAAVRQNLSNPSGSSVAGNEPSVNGESSSGDASNEASGAHSLPPQLDTAADRIEHVGLLNDKEKQQIEEIESEYLKKVDELNRLFVENDARRRKREIPDYLCGKISFELMHDPVITPSGITYDRYDIEQHLQRVGRFDPVTRQELTIDQLIPNLSMKEVIENFVLENDWLDGAL